MADNLVYAADGYWGLAILRNDGSGVPRLEVRSFDGLQLKLALLGEPGRVYGVEESADLARWTVLRSAIAAGTEVVIPVDLSQRGRFYRAVD